MKELVFNFYSRDNIPFDTVSNFGTSCLIELESECLSQGFKFLHIDSINNKFTYGENYMKVTVTVKYKFSNKDNPNE